jgi:peptidoglycan/xylan/chitin deacetylase (PgdA/CDA1 family)
MTDFLHTIPLLRHALIYHDVVARSERDSAGFPGPVAGRYKVDPADFERHLDAIAATGVEVGLWTPADTGDGRAVLTFDDGGASALDAAAALERRGWHGHFFVTTGRVGTGGFLDADGVRELARRGHAVGGHSHSHPTYMGKLPRGEILDEWRRSREALAEILGAPPAGASVPGGFFTPDVARCAAEAGYEWLMTSEPESRVRSGCGLPVKGRYTVWATTPASTAAAYARGARGRRARLWLEWNAKQRAKRISPRAFEALRRVRAKRA